MRVCGYSVCGSFGYGLGVYCVGECPFILLTSSINQDDSLVVAFAINIYHSVYLTAPLLYMTKASLSFAHRAALPPQITGEAFPHK